jgi:hypothetical protein
MIDNTARLIVKMMAALPGAVAEIDIFHNAGEIALVIATELKKLLA